MLPDTVHYGALTTETIKHCADLPEFRGGASPARLLRDKRTNAVNLCLEPVRTAELILHDLIIGATFPYYHALPHSARYGDTPTGSVNCQLPKYYHQLELKVAPLSSSSSRSDSMINRSWICYSTATCPKCKMHGSDLTRSLHGAQDNLDGRPMRGSVGPRG